MQQLSVDQIKASVRIEDVVRRRGVALRTTANGERLEGHCPFHPFDETPSFNLYVTTQRYHCFGCGADGDVIDFVQAFEVCSFQEALHRLSGNIIALPTAQLARSRTPREVLPVPFPLKGETEKRWNPLLTEAQQIYHQTLLAHPTLKEDIQHARGITAEGIELCQLGYVDGSLLPGLLDTPEKRHLAETIGLLSITQQERLLRRLVIPEYIDETCIWMIGRAVYQPIKNQRHPKYLGLSLGKPLLGYGLALKRLHERHLIRAILIVEGAIDYVIASQWDLPVVCVALIGTHASMRQQVMLLDLQQRANNVPFLLSLDADDAGRQASAHLLSQLRQRTAAVSELPLIAGVKDIGDLGIHPEGYCLLRAAIEQALSASASQGGQQ
jgi:DNA primase catalytic core